MKNVLFKVYFNQYTDLKFAAEALDEFEYFLAEMEWFPSVLRCTSKLRLPGRNTANKFFLASVFEFTLDADLEGELVELLRSTWGEIADDYGLKHSAFSECAVHDAPSLSRIEAVKAGTSGLAFIDALKGPSLF